MPKTSNAVSTESGMAVDPFLENGFGEMATSPAEPSARVSLIEPGAEPADPEFALASSTSLGPDKVKAALSTLTNNVSAGESVFVPMNGDMMQLVPQAGGGYEGTIFHAATTVGASPAKTTFSVDRDGNVSGTQTQEFKASGAGAAAWTSTGVTAGRAKNDADISSMIESRTDVEYRLGMHQRVSDLRTALGSNRSVSIPFSDGVELSITKYSIPEVPAGPGRVAIPAHDQFVVRRNERGQWAQVTIDGRDGVMRDLRGSSSLPGTTDLSSYPVDIEQRLSQAATAAGGGPTVPVAPLPGTLPPGGPVIPPPPVGPDPHKHLSAAQQQALRNACGACASGTMGQFGLVRNSAGAMTIGLDQARNVYQVQIITGRYSGPGDKSYDSVSLTVDRAGNILETPVKLRTERGVTQVVRRAGDQYKDSDFAGIMSTFNSIVAAEAAPAGGGGPGPAPAATPEALRLVGCARCVGGAPTVNGKQELSVNSRDAQGNYHITFRARYDGAGDQSFDEVNFCVHGTTGEVTTFSGTNHQRRGNVGMREAKARGLLNQALRQLEQAGG